MDKPKFQTQLFINNEFVDALEGATFDVFNPFDNSLLAKVSEARPADIDRAVAAARKAFPAWAAMSPSDRGVLIGKLADAIEKDRDNLALIETLDTGHPIRDTRNLDVMRTVATFRYFPAHQDLIEAVTPLLAGRAGVPGYGRPGALCPDSVAESHPAPSGNGVAGGTTGRTVGDLEARGGRNLLHGCRCRRGGSCR